MRAYWLNSWAYEFLHSNKLTISFTKETKAGIGINMNKDWKMNKMDEAELLNKL